MKSREGNNDGKFAEEDSDKVQTRCWEILLSKCHPYTL
jgi:hypothetical protein